MTERLHCCCICKLFASFSFSSVLRHIGNTHARDSNLSILCPVPGCPRSVKSYIYIYIYNNFESFRSHVYRKHRQLLKEVPSQLSSTEQQGSNNSCNTSEYQDNVETNGGVDDNDDFQYEQDSEDSLQLDAARFLLKTREERKITQAAVDGIVHDVSNLWDSAMIKVDIVHSKVR